MINNMFEVHRIYEVLVNFAQFSIFPWCLLDFYNDDSSYNEFGEAVFNYGILISLLNLGCILGCKISFELRRGAMFPKYLPGTSSSSSIRVVEVVNSVAFLSLAISYILICLISHYNFMCIASFILGTSGSFILDVNGSDGQSLNLKSSTLFFWAGIMLFLLKLVMISYFIFFQKL